MKQLILIMVLLLGASSISFPQKIITENIPINWQKMDMKLDFADIIRIQAWNGNTIVLKVSANINDNEYNDYYTLDVDDKGGSIGLKEKIDFDGIKKKAGERNVSNFSMDINYTLKVPEYLCFKLKTISGNVILERTDGSFSVNTVSGFIDYAVPAAQKSSINLSTVSGNVYSNVDFDNKPACDFSPVGTKRVLSLNGGGRKIELKTVSGDIYLRKCQ